jgi:hypothetical protein
MAKSTYTTFASQSIASKLDRDHKRATDARRKYAHGTITGRGSTQPRPARVIPRHPNVATHLEYGMKLRAQDQAQEAEDLNRATRNGNHTDYVETAYPTTVDSGLRDDLQEDFIYSYDHATGPSTGSTVLGAAVDRAVERFESKVTESLVKDEYSVVDETEAAEDKEPEHDEDFELV